MQKILVLRLFFTTREVENNEQKNFLIFFFSALIVRNKDKGRKIKASKVCSKKNTLIFQIYKHYSIASKQCVSDLLLFQLSTAQKHCKHLKSKTFRGTLLFIIQHHFTKVSCKWHIFLPTYHITLAQHLRMLLGASEGLVLKKDVKLQKIEGNSLWILREPETCFDVFFCVALNSL